MAFKKRKGETAGREVFHRVKFLGVEYRSDLIAYDYMRRWCVNTKRGGARLHKILRGDNLLALHDHPMDFTSIILKGGYIEHLPGGEKRWYFPGDVNVKRAEDLHALELIEPSQPTWTLVLAGPFRRDWGFMTDDEGWIPAGEFDAWKERRADRAVVCGAPNDLNARRCVLRVGHASPHASEGLSWTDDHVPTEQYDGMSKDRWLKGGGKF